MNTINLSTTKIQITIMKKNRSTSILTLAALGMVYGDIGTSPLYALKLSFSAAHLPINEFNIIGLVSLILWTLLFVVTIKYIFFILSADNKGEGGVITLMQLARKHLKGKMAERVILMGLAGAALFYGDAIITPAISVMSAVDGLSVVGQEWKTWVIPISIVILFALFCIQYKGVQKISRLFGLLMLIWFGSLAVMGIYQIIQTPKILYAINPYYAVDFIFHHHILGFISLGAIALAITGAEALYADMGQVGKRPIQIAWISIVLPALAINYIGQGALLLRYPEAVINPFFLSAPEWALIPVVVLATIAAIIASQAVITGAYAITRQAIQLGFLPRMNIIYTSKDEAESIYLPTVNWLLLVAVIAVIMTFHDETHLAAAYGIAITGTMVLTTLIFYVVITRNWEWAKWYAVPLTLFFLIIDGFFFVANLLKLPKGGWFPILIAILMLFIFNTWRRGREVLSNITRDDSLLLDDFLRNLEEYPPKTVPGNAVFLVSDSFSIPKALLHNLKHNKILHEYNILLTIQTKDVPYVAANESLAIKQMSPRFTRIIANYGFQEIPNINQILSQATIQGIDLELMETSFFLSFDSINISPKTPYGHMSRLRTRVFKWLYRNSTPSTDFYRIPGNRVVELGSKVSM